MSESKTPMGALIERIYALELEWNKMLTNPKVLDTLELSARSTLLVWNKAEVADAIKLRALLDRHGGLAVSALSGEGMEALLEVVERQLFLDRAAQVADSA